MTQELLGRVHRELLDVLNSINQDKIHHDGDDFHELLNDVEKALAEHAMQEVQRLGQEIEQEPVMILPDGSAFGVMSFPLPDDHWLYAPNEYKDGEYEPIDLPKPILTHELRDAVVAAVRYAVRGATMRGQETDFDPDALVQNAVYALCGPYATPPKPKPEQEPVAFYVYKPTLPRGHLGNVSDGDLPWVYDQDPSSGYSARMLVHTTPPQRKPLTDEQIEQLEQDTCAMEFPETVRAIEAAHGIKGDA